MSKQRANISTTAALGLLAASAHTRKGDIFAPTEKVVSKHQGTTNPKARAEARRKRKK